MNKTMMDEIFVENAPDVPGLCFRHFRGEADFPAMIAVVEGSKEADGAEWVLSLEDMRQQFAHMEDCNPATDMIMVEIEGQVVGHGRCWWREQLDHTRIYSFYAHLLPTWRETGIREVMMRYMEQRLRQIAAEHTPPLPSEFEVWSSDTQTHMSRLLDDAGYRVVRYGLDMVRPNLANIPNCPVPQGIDIRPGTLAEWPQIWLAAREAFRDHWGAAEWPESYIEEDQGLSTFYPPLWRVAWAGAEVAGGVLNYIDRLENEVYGRKRGYTEMIFVRRPWRGQGLAKVLIAQSLAVLKEAGMNEAALSVDAENLSGALHLYHNMGFQETKRFMRYRKALV